jgi:large subunit ribosomal protein L10
MPNQKKVETVEELRERIERAQIVIAGDYSGLTVTQMSDLRRAVRETGELRVVKNRLFARAAEAAGHPEMAELLEGPTVIVFGFDDIAAPAKAVSEYQRTARNTFAVRKGAFGGQVLSSAQLQDLANLPPRPVLLGQLAGLLQAPVANLAGLIKNILSVPPGRLLNDSFTTFAGLLEARAKQLEA